MTEPAATRPGPGPAPGTPEVPALPVGLADPRPVIAAGTGLWAVALAVVGLRALLSGGGPGSAVATCAAGVALGAIGYGIFFWQRRTVRGGGRGQQGIG